MIFCVTAHLTLTNYKKSVKSDTFLMVHYATDHNIINYIKMELNEDIIQQLYDGVDEVLKFDVR